MPNDLQHDLIDVKAAVDHLAADMEALEERMASLELQKPSPLGAAVTSVSGGMIGSLLMDLLGKLGGVHTPPFVERPMASPPVGPASPFAHVAVPPAIEDLLRNYPKMRTTLRDLLNKLDDEDIQAAAPDAAAAKEF